MAESGESESISDPDQSFDSAAVGIALDRARARRRKVGDDAADRFLAAQEALIADQRHHLREQFRHLRLKHFSDRLKVLLQLLTIAAGAAVLGVIGLVAWQASRADGIVVDAFSVPPAYAAKGLTGSVLAEQVLNRLVRLDRDANPLVSTSVQGAWTQSAKIELPQTGVSLDEVERLLRRWLGHEKHVTGELVETPAGVLLSAQTEAGQDVRVEGDPANLAQLTDQLAQQLYAHAQPINYAMFLQRQDRLDEADAILTQVLSETDSEAERARAHHIRGVVAARRGDRVAARAEYIEALKSPILLRRALSRRNLASVEGIMGHAEAAVALYRQALQELARASGLSPAQAEAESAIVRASVNFETGDCAAALVDAQFLAGRRVQGEGTSSGPIGVQACLHDMTAARRLSGARPLAGVVLARADDWPGVLAAMESRSTGTTPFHPTLPAIANEVTALAMLGRLDEASALATSLPADCYQCQIARARLAEAKGDRAGADRLYATAVAMAPHIPTAQREWGRTRVARGDAAGALAQAEAAVKITPHYADAIELAGEALAAKGDAPGAVKRYAEAAKLAPRWGRLHMKWGEALAKQGKAAEAKAQFAAAAGLDLTAAERSELAGVFHG